MRQACLNLFCVNLYAEESDAVSICILFLLDLECQVTADLTEVSFVLGWGVRECCGEQEYGQQVVKVMEHVFSPWVGLENPFPARCEDVLDGWQFVAAD